MSETAESIIHDALLEIQAQEGEQQIESFEFQRGVRALNRMMAEWAADEIELGYTEVSTPSDTISIPAGAVSGVVYNLAVRLAPALDIAITPALAKAASDSYKTLERIGFDIDKANFPGNLPIGSGNYDSANSYSGQQFYDDCCEDTNEC